MWNRIAGYANQIKFRRVLFLLIGLIQFIYAALMVISAPRTIPALLLRDTGIPGTVLAVLFLWSGFRFARSLVPRRSLIMALVPLAIYNAIGIAYVIAGEFGLTAMLAHGGILVLSALCLLTPLYPRFKISLSPLISLGLMLYAVGIVGQSTTGTAGYLTSQAPAATVALAFLFAMAAGYVFDNHLRPQFLFLAFIPQFLYSLAALAGHITSPLSVPLNGGLSHWLLSFLLLVFVFTEAEGADGSNDPR